jgi:protein-arginine kinase activator protein McsA
MKLLKRRGKLIRMAKVLGCHNCGDGFKGEIIKTKKGIYCSLCGMVFPDGVTPLLVKSGKVKKVNK